MRYRQEVDCEYRLRVKGAENSQESGKETKHQKPAIQRRNLSLETHRGWAFYSSASTVESEWDTTCQQRKETQTDEGERQMKGGGKRAALKRVGTETTELKIYRQRERERERKAVPLICFSRILRSKAGLNRYLSLAATRSAEMGQ